jgi:type VI secretion system secreted protein Hcp
MAVVDIFMKIDGIEGEAKDVSGKKHTGEIDVVSWSWGATQTGTHSTGGGGGAGKVSVSDLTFTKHVDKSSTALLLACCNGKHIKDATLTVRKAGETPLEFLSVKLTDILVSSVQEGGASNGDLLPTEHVTLNFSKFEVVYKEQDNKGAQKGGDIKMGWDVKGNIKV